MGADLVDLGHANPDAQHPVDETPVVGCPEGGVAELELEEGEAAVIDGGLESCAVQARGRRGAYNACADLRVDAIASPPTYSLITSLSSCRRG